MALVAMRERQVSTLDDVGQEDGTRDKSRGNEEKMEIENIDNNHITL